ncbi:MAG TPA: hypothetical protein VFA94_09695 [Acidimicrobiales bacterium]|nr:hypothetical protein [Acidimicrobiales bacterium]
MRTIALLVAGLIGVVLVATSPALAQVPTTPTTSTTRAITTSTTAAPTTSTAKPTTTTTAAPTTSTTKKPTTTTRATATTTQQPSLTTIPTPVVQATTTTTPHVTPQSGQISPLFIVLSAAGFALALGLFAVQWFLTRPGRSGWTL